MICKECPDFDKELGCQAYLFDKDYDVPCLLKMIIQELRISDDVEGDEWKFLP